MAILDATGRPIIQHNSIDDSFKSFVAEFEKNPARVKKMMIELDQKTRSLTKKDTARWRAAHQQALNIENPRRRELYGIYADTELDMHLTGCVEQINTAVLGRAFKIKDRVTGKEDEKLTELFENEWFKEFMSYDLECYMWGHSLIQLGNVITLRGVKQLDGIELIPREHVCPEYGVILRDPTDDIAQGVPYRTDNMYNWLVECGRKNDLGLYLKCCPHTISKKNMASYWDTFGEIFGIPIRIAKTTSTVPTDHERIMNMLSSMGSAAYALFPEGTTVDVKESKQGDSYNVFDKRIERCDSELSKGVLLQTMTIENGSSLSQSETHLDIFNRAVESRADHVRDTVNNKLIPRLQRLGFPLSDKHYFEWDYAVEYTPEQQIRIEEMVLGKYEVDPIYFREKYNIPILGARQIAVEPVQPDPLKKKSNLSTSIVALYGERPATAVASDPTDIDELIRRLRGGTEIDIDPETLEATSEQLKQAMREGYALSWNDVTIDTPDYQMLSHLENNVYQFSAAKNYQQMRELTDALVDEQGNPRSFSDLQQVARHIDTQYNVDWLATERATAISSAMTARDWQGYQDTKTVMPTLRYVTAGDKRVRHEHAALDGVQRPVDDPFWDTYYPPNGFCCRCTTTQTASKAITNTRDIDPIEIPVMFKTNLAKTGLIFPKDHPYYDGVPRQVMRKAVAYLPPENTFRTVGIGDGTTIEIHPLHGADEIKENVEIARVMKSNGYKEIKLLPVIHEKDIVTKRKFYPQGYKFTDIRKNADAIVDGEVFDFKLSSRRNLHMRITEAADQADNVVIKLRENMPKYSIAETVKNCRNECRINKVSIIFTDNTIVSF